MSRDLFDTDEEYNKQLMKELIDIVQELGWQVYIPGKTDEENVPGLIIGTEAFLDEILDYIDEEKFDA